MKIIAIGRNYTDHAKELNNPVPTEPVVFMKPDTALLKENKAFYLPDFSNDIQHEIEVVIKIGKEGKNIAEKFASKYYEELSLGIDFTARDLQQRCKEKGLPWEIAKSFDHSSPIGKFIPVSSLENINDLDFSLMKNKELVQKGNTREMIFSFDRIIAYVSSFFTLKKGDLIYTGTPAGVSSVAIGDQLEGYLNNEKIIEVLIK